MHQPSDTYILFVYETRLLSIGPMAKCKIIYIREIYLKDLQVFQIISEGALFQIVYLASYTQVYARDISDTSLSVVKGARGRRLMS